MRNIFTLAALLFSLSVSGQTYIDTTNGRYWNEVFPTVTITPNVVYGSAVNVNGINQSLDLDIYQPWGDTFQFRPVLVFAHGGSFIFGTKNDQDIVDLCMHFAKRGYVCLSINYRLGMNLPIDSVNAGKAVIRATQDMRAAIRFLRKDFSLGNNYHIHPDYIFAGGVSAGAFTALHLAYMDSTEVPSYLNLAGLGGLEGSSGNPGFNSGVMGVINLCGALGDSSWIQAGDIPFVSMHGDSDQTVPYGSASVVVFGIPVIPVDGSSSLNIRANHVGVTNPLYTWQGANHVPFVGTGTAAAAYMDTAIGFIRTFLRSFLGIPPLGVTEAGSENRIRISPNPAKNTLTFYALNRFAPTDLVISDVTGRIVWNEKLVHSGTLDVSFLPRGMYILRFSDKKVTVSRKLVLE